MIRLFPLLALLVVPAYGQKAPVPNRAPLETVPMTALPLGSVKPEGWLREQMELQRNGLTGHAEELLPAVSPDSAWRGGQGEDWEKGPYYVKGLIPLAWGLEDDSLKQEVKKWIEPILASQREDGFYGPSSNDDWWPRMVVNYLLRDYYEATGDERVLPFLTKYFQHMGRELPGRPLRDWGKSRAGDDIDTIFWLYNHTGDESLLPVAKLLAEQAYPWTDIFTNNRFLMFEEFQPRHGVNIPQALKMPAVYSQLSKDEADKHAYAKGQEHLMQDHGLAVGINSGTEFLAGRSTVEGIELCSVVERMLSDATVARILGDPAIQDHLELMAYNLLPGSLSPNIHQHVYYCVPNNVIAAFGPKGYDQDHHNATNPSPISGFPCCCYNFHMGWPKLAQNSWAATSDGGLAPLVYAPTTVSTVLPNGIRVRIEEQTSYPFGDEVRFVFHPEKPATFAFHLRQPGWCETPEIALNGEKADGFSTRVEREWKDGDTLVLHLPREVKSETGIKHSVSFRYGPLVLSLKVDEHWQSIAKASREGFDSFRIDPTSPWNYALEVDPAQPAASIEVEAKPLEGNPFDPKTTPIHAKVKGKRLPGWDLAWHGRLANDPPTSPVRSDQPLEDLTLVPFGSEMLRVTSFPVLGEKEAPKSFSDDFSDGNFDGWLTYGGSWFVLDGRLQPATNAHSGSFGSHGVKAVAVDTDFADLEYEGTVSVGDAGDSGLIFRVHTPALGSDAYHGYYAGISASDDRVILGRADGDWTELGTFHGPIDADHDYRLKVEAIGPRIRVFLDGKRVIETEDATFSSGMIGVRNYSAQTDRLLAQFTRLNAVAR
ncbi:beta-L-arabinofuranosidase domain-containing protein [Haloferula sargassicola]|uniref:Non-reducing end beta-L-arabinofuranosidase n=1 Tax=Haloferula sargassicola TaxID=490096 RepID=A0ABP9UNU4_9BACT